MTSKTISTSRTFIRPLEEEDGAFILELVNCDGWLQFIGDRQVRSIDAAIAYIKNILGSPHITYRVVTLSNQNVPIGIVTLIKKDYLPFHDIGFAFLPTFAGKGYACEATQTFLQDLIAGYADEKLLATTIPENIRSIRLLQKLGFEFDSEINIEGKKLQVYAALTDELKKSVTSVSPR